MKRKKLFYNAIFVLFTIIMLFLYSCNKNDDLSNQIESVSNNGIVYKQGKINPKLEQFIKVVSYALNDQKFRKELKSEALKQFDGDYDVLLNFSDKNSRTLEKILISAYTDINMKKQSESQDELALLKKEFPNLQISIPVNCELWNELNEKPLITVVPENFNDKERFKLKAFKENDEIVWLDSKITPEVPVIVIGFNERTNLSGNLLKNIQPDDGDGGGGSGSGSGSGDSDCGNRVNGGMEKVQKIIFTDLNAVESWIRGKPEIRLNVFKSDGTSRLVSKYIHPSRSDVNNVWYTLNWSIINWYWSSYGDYLIFAWTEEDSGNVISFNLPGVTIKVSDVVSITANLINIKTTDAHDEIAFYAVNKSDPCTRYYDSGIFKFKNKF